MDFEPAEYGLFAGHTATGKHAYIGLGSWNAMSLNTGPLTLNPPGILLPDNGGVGTFVNTTGAIWYLRRGRHNWYDWKCSENAETVKFAIDFGTNSSGTPFYFGRIKKNGTVVIGIIPLYMGKMFYVDEHGKMVGTDKGYQVLTCRAWYRE
jgi:hypothetical protein